MIIYQKGELLNLELNAQLNNLAKQSTCKNILKYVTRQVYEKKCRR